MRLYHNSLRAVPRVVRAAADGHVRGPNASSDGGAVLLKAADRRLGLISRLAAALVDERQHAKVRHAVQDLLTQRIYGLALGLGEGLFETVLTRHAHRRRKVRRITIDMDLTDDPTHGAQQQAFFNKFYDAHCYLPLLAFLTFDREP